MNKQKIQKIAEKLLAFLKTNRTYVIAGGTSAVVVALAVLIGLTVGRNMQTASSNASVNPQTGAETAQTAGETLAVPLEENGHPEVNALIDAYYRAAAEGDVDTLRSLTQGMDEDQLIYLQKRSAYIEAYQNLICYTKSGREDNSYVVYVSYDVKFVDVETTVPGVSPHLVRMGDDGVYYIYEGEVDEETDAYLQEISAQDDVVDLYNEVQVRYDEAVTENEGLGNFLSQMSDELTVEVGEALAESTQEETQTQQEADVPKTTASGKVRAIDVVNVRASDSEQAERIGRVQIGDELTLIENRANGWSKVEYEGKEAFIKSEFLEAVETQEEQMQEPESQQEGGSAPATDLPDSGTIMVGDTVNIRESADENADRLAVCYAGSKLQILSHQANGWTKVSYEGMTGYVRTDVLKVQE